MTRHYTLHFSILWRFVSISVIPILFLGFLTSNFMARKKREDITNHCQDLAQTVVLEIQEFLNSPLIVLNNLTSVLANVDQLDLPINEIMNIVVQNTEGFESIYWLNKDGIVQNVGLLKDMVPNRLDFIGLDLKNWPAYQKAIKLNRPVWSDSFISFVTGERSISLAYPMKDGDVLTANFCIKELQHIRDTIQMEPEMNLMILDNKGRVIYHSMDMPEMEYLNMSQILPVQNGLSSVSGMCEFTWNQVDYIGKVAKIPRQNWIVLVSQSKAQAFVTIYWLRFFFFVGMILAVLFAILFSLVFSKALTQPLNQFCTGAMAVADGQYDTPLPTAGYEEIDHLASVFQNMAKAVQEREKQYITLTETVPVGIVRCELSGQCVYVNQRTVDLLGADPESLAGHGWIKFLHPEDRDWVLERWEQTCEEGISFEEEYRFIKPDGAVKWVIGQVIREKNKSGEPIGFVGTLMDITKNKHAEQVFQTLLEGMVGSTGKEAFDKVTKVLCDWLNCFGAVVGEIQGDSIRAVSAYFQQHYINDLVYPLQQSPCEQVIQTRSFLHFPEDIQKLFPNDEDLKTHGLNGYVGIPLVTSENECIGLINCLSKHPLTLPEKAKDVLTIMTVKVTSELQRIRAERQQEILEEKLRHSQKMEAIGQLAGGVAHDFNNLMTPILGYSEMLLMDLDPSDSHFESIKQINVAAEKASALTSQLLAFSRKQTLDTRILDLNDIICSMDKILRRTILENVEISIQLEKNLFPVKADKVQIEQILMNMAVNAQDAMPQGGELLIETTNFIYEDTDSDGPVDLKSGDYAVLSIRDNGVGMDSETKQRIFEPFFTTKGIGRGTGLGLATVYGIVKQHRGTITVQSEIEKGSCFKIFLPRQEVFDIFPDNHTALINTNHGNETILLVEDNEMVRDLTKQILVRYGYNVLDVENAQQAVDMSVNSNVPIHLLLTDVIMPGMNGKQLYQKIYGVRKEIHALFMSGYADDVLSKQGMLEEKINFIAKPFTTRNLLESVRKALNSLS